MAGAFRLVEALALLPILYLPRNADTIILCTGPMAATLAADVLRWRDIKAVYLLQPPTQPLLDPSQATPRKDRRVLVGTPPIGTCTAILTSPGEAPDPYLGFITKDGVVCVSTTDPTQAKAMYQHGRQLFPRGLVPWREFLPAEIYGYLASPQSTPKRVRDPPGGARRLNATYLRSLFSFAADECPMIFNGAPALPAPASPGVSGR